MRQEMFLLEQEIVMLFADGVDATASWQKIAFEKHCKIINRGFCLVDACSQSFSVLDGCLNFRMRPQGIQETDAALCRLNCHLRPKTRRICLFPAEIGDALLDRTGSPI